MTIHVECGCKVEAGGKAFGVAIHYCARHGAVDDLLKACKQQHDALDSAMAKLITSTRDLYPDNPELHFMPSKSPMFAAIMAGNIAIGKAESGS